MEFPSFTSYQIAILVLGKFTKTLISIILAGTLANLPNLYYYLFTGYLKTEKCHLAFDTFYKTLPHFHSSNNSKIRTKYIITRVIGKSLYDFLNEYAHISKLSKNSIFFAIL